MAKKKKDRSGRAAVAAKRGRITGNSVRYKCLNCGAEEDIPKSAIEFVEVIDDLGELPQFDCKNCDGIMEPEDKAKRYNDSEVIHIVSTGIPDDDGDYMF